jgi:hypothetical protein
MITFVLIQLMSLQSQLSTPQDECSSCAHAGVGDSEQTLERNVLIKSYCFSAELIRRRDLSNEKPGLELGSFCINLCPFTDILYVISEWMLYVMGVTRDFVYAKFVE